MPRPARCATSSSERAETFFESGQGRVNWRYLPQIEGSAVVFAQGRLGASLSARRRRPACRRTASRPATATSRRCCASTRRRATIYFQGVGKETGRDPYFRHFYRIGFDGKEQTLLTPEDGDHTVDLSPSGKYFVDAYSKPDTPPVAVLRDVERQGGRAARDRRHLAARRRRLEAADAVHREGARRQDRSLRPDVPADELRSERKRYPIINNIYPGPQTGSVGGRSFSAARGDAQAIAELGFIVVQIDGMGTPWRSRTFHEAYYGDMGDNTLPDQVAGMKELASRLSVDRSRARRHLRPFRRRVRHGRRDVPLSRLLQGRRVAGRAITTTASTKTTGRRSGRGCSSRKPDGTSNYDDQANQMHAKNLKGKLLLAHGTMDTNVPVYSTLLVVDELIKANKDFDLIMFPNRGPRLRRRAVHGAPALGLFREAPAGRRAAGGLRDAGAADAGAAADGASAAAVIGVRHSSTGVSGRTRLRVHGPLPGPESCSIALMIAVQVAGAAAAQAVSAGCGDAEIRAIAAAESMHAARRRPAPARSRDSWQ